MTGAGERGILVRTAQDPLALRDSVRREIWATDRNVALTLTGTLEGFIAEFSYAAPRFGFLLMSLFAALGLVLVSIGVYSVLSYATARQTHEIGIRMAIGAERGDVLKMVLASGARLVGLGIALGVAASFGLTRLIASQLWGVSASDPVTLGAVVALILATGFVACWLPARRATRVDPVVALRYE
jgi:putative ABC transport system permease protein